VAVVAVVDHKYVVPPLAIKSTLLPLQNVVAPLEVITAIGNGFTVTTWLADPVHPFALDTVTE
jgi:hypothetical protein